MEEYPVFLVEARNSVFLAIAFFAGKTRGAGDTFLSICNAKLFLVAQLMRGVVLGRFIEQAVGVFVACRVDSMLSLVLSYRSFVAVVEVGMLVLVGIVESNVRVGVNALLHRCVVAVGRKVAVVGDCATTSSQDLRVDVVIRLTWIHLFGVSGLLVYAAHFGGRLV